jgi:hypothetical protein
MNWRQTIGLIIAVSAIIALCFLVIFPAFYAQEEPEAEKEARKSEAPAGDERSVLPKLKGVNWKTPSKKKPAEKKLARKAGKVGTTATAEKEAAALANAEMAEKVGPKPLLELQEMTWYEKEGYAVVVGTVKNVSDKSLPSVQVHKNVSDKSLPSVQVHVTFEGEDGWFIAAEHSMIDLNPIFPGQVSPFTVISRYYPEITNAVLDFRKFSGENIPWDKAEVPEGETEAVGAGEADESMEAIEAPAAQ